MKVEQIKSTRNQSTAHFTENCIFLGNNRYDDGTLSVDAKTNIQDGLLVVRDVSKPNAYKLATDANLADVVGVAKVGFFDVDLEPSTDLNIAVCVKGEVEANGLALPSGVTLDTVVGATKMLRDVVEGIGLHLVNTTEQTRF